LTGKDAIKYALSKKYDLIYLDLGLPDLDGKEVAQNIRSNITSQNQHTPIIALTAHADEKIRQECLAVQINKVLLKPLLEEDFRRNIAEFLNHTQSLPVIDLLLWQKRNGDNEQLAKETQQIIFQELFDVKSKTLMALQKKDYLTFSNLILQFYNELLYCGLPALEAATATALLVQAIQEKHADQIQLLHKSFCLEIDRVLKK
jgi:CheY-like chemotaxis protein